MKTILSLSLALIVLCTMSCRGPAPESGHGHDHGEHGHVHDDAHGHGDDGHEAHGTVSVTHWTTRSELFMEYPQLEAGHASRFAIHITDLRDFSPLTDGEATVELYPVSGDSRLSFSATLSRPGILGADVIVPQPGEYELRVRVTGPGFSAVHDVGSVTVRDAGAAAIAVKEDGDAIAFLKEQQWTLDFATTLVDRRPLQASVTVPAEVQPRSGGEAVLVAPVPGRIAAGTAVPVEGSRVRTGQVLARIVPGSEDLLDAAALRAALVEAEQQWELAIQERDRVDRLVTSRALPARRAAEAASAVTAAAARRDAARQRLGRFEQLTGSGGEVSASDLFVVRAPFAGSVAEARFAPGSSVERGQPLARIVDVDRVHVVGFLPESSSSIVRTIASGELVGQHGSVQSLGSPLNVSSVIATRQRAIDVRFAMDNRDGGLRVGQNVSLRLIHGEEQSHPAVPETAIVDDRGRPVVFVQTAGESFERRAVNLAHRAGGYVHVLEGVAVGERVVSKGAYLIKLASNTTQAPSHGHAH